MYLFGMVKSLLKTMETKAFCDVCDSRGWDGYVGTFEYDPDQLSTWTFTTNRRVSKLKAGKNVAGYISQPRLRSIPGRIRHGGDGPLRVRCPSGHRLRELDSESVMRLLDDASERVRLLSG
jgi:hypothetical protein